jgi:hypothetical protein
MRHRRWPRTAHPACRASRCALTGQRASIAGNGSGRRLVCCSPPRYGVHTPADRTAQPKISQSPAPSAGGSGSPPALPEPGIPGSTQVHKPVNPTARIQRGGQPGTYYPERAASVINLPGETHPARRTTSGYASADIPRKIPESAMVPHRFGREPVACRLAAGQSSSATTASPARPNEQRGIGKQSVLHLRSGDDVFRPEVAERQRDQDQRVGDRHRGALDHPGP